MIRLGIDFDNTIVCYDGVFHKAAVDKGWIPAGPKVLTKDEVRDQLRRQGQEEEWIHLQGYVYGARMGDAAPYPGVLDFFARCVRGGVPVRIISHRTRRPFRGPEYDLHASAQEWLDKNGFFDPARIGMARENAYFELKKEEKLARVAQTGCTHFIDDLPELLSESFFPAGVEPLLFDPTGAHEGKTRFKRLASWNDAASLLGAPAGNAKP